MFQYSAILLFAQCVSQHIWLVDGWPKATRGQESCVEKNQPLMIEADHHLPNQAEACDPLPSSSTARREILIYDEAKESVDECMFRCIMRIAPQYAYYAKDTIIRHE